MVAEERECNGGGRTAIATTRCEGPERKCSGFFFARNEPGKVEGVMFCPSTAGDCCAQVARNFAERSVAAIILMFRTHYIRDDESSTPTSELLGTTEKDLGRAFRVHVAR